MDGETEQIDQEGDHNETDNSGDNMGSKLKDGHLGVSKLAPQILNRVDTNESSDEETDQLHAGDETNAETSHEQPEEPFRLKAPLALRVELGPAQSRSDGAEQEHGVEENKAADGGVRVLAEDHESNEPNSSASEVQLLGRPVCQGDAGSSPEGIELAHEGVVELRRVCLAGLELERAIVASQIATQTDQEFTGRGMDIEVELAFQVMAAKLSETVRLTVSIATLSKTGQRIN